MKSFLLFLELVGYGRCQRQGLRQEEKTKKKWLNEWVSPQRKEVKSTNQPLIQLEWRRMKFFGMEIEWAGWFGWLNGAPQIKFNKTIKEIYWISLLLLNWIWFASFFFSFLLNWIKLIHWLRPKWKAAINWIQFTSFFIHCCGLWAGGSSPPSPSIPLISQLIPFQFSWFWLELKEKKMVDSLVFV